MFTVEQRGRWRQALLDMARADPRIVAGGEVGSLAVGPGDRWSDVDLTFGVADGTTPRQMLDQWTPRLERAFGAVELFDLPHQSSLYRVFLFPGALQVDLSFTPAAEFGALGPRFRLLFGTAIERTRPASAPAPQLFGLAVHHAVRARSCIERGQVWQAEYWVSGVRDQAMALACRRRGLEAAHARGADALPAGVRAACEPALVRSLERDELLRALEAAIELLLRESGEAADVAARVERDLRALASQPLAGG
jgi:hypothetical protein